MAPELYDENYNEKVDIYAFGMLLLEIITRDVPYHECTNPAQIYKKVTQGIPPASLRRVKSKDARNFVLLCLGIGALVVRYVTGDNFEEEHTEGVYVHLFIVILVVELGCHELGRAKDTQWLRNQRKYVFEGVRQQCIKKTVRPQQQKLAEHNTNSPDSSY